MTVAVRNRQRRYQLDLPALRRLARQAVEIIGNSHTEISLVFVSDEEMARHNEQFHHVAGPTDILTFDYGVAGELIISVDHAVTQARRYRTKPARELALYVVHGLLHLAGHDDRTAAQRKTMRAVERRVMGELKGSWERIVSATGRGGKTWRSGNLPGCTGILPVGQFR